MMINLSIFKKSSVGISVSNDNISIVELERGGREYRIKDIKSFDSKGCIKLSLTDANITNPVLFKKAIKTIVGNKRRCVSLSIPDASVKTALLELESTPSKKSELEKLIRWKMEKSLPFFVEDAKMSYQIIKKDGVENNNSILVSLIKKDVLYQYEELLKISGIEPVYINSSSFHIFNLYHDFMIKDEEGGQNFIFLHYIDNALSVMIFKDGCPDFIRIKALRAGRGNIKKIREELLASLKFYSHNREISDIKYLYYFADTDIASDELIEDMKIKRLWIEQIPWLNTFFINPPVSPFFKGGKKESLPLLNLIPAIGAAMELR